jgi:hypothetical protein
VTDTYYELTTAELEVITRRFAADPNRSIRAEIAKYAGDLYGTKAYSVQVVVKSEYNDEDYDDVIDDVIVRDMEGEILEPDFGLPFWEAYFSGVDPNDEDYRTTLDVYGFYGWGVEQAITGDETLHRLPIENGEWVPSSERNGVPRLFAKVE